VGEGVAPRIRSSPSRRRRMGCSCSPRGRAAHWPARLLNTSSAIRMCAGRRSSSAGSRSTVAPPPTHATTGAPSNRRSRPCRCRALYGAAFGGAPDNQVDRLAGRLPSSHLRRLPRGQLRQCPRRDGGRAVQDRVNPPARSLAHRGPGRAAFWSAFTRRLAPHAWRPTKPCA
jgi:hypothetical protein